MNHHIIVRGGGDIATGTIHKLHRAGYRVLVLELQTPSVIRRTVAFSSAIFQQTNTVEGVTARVITSPDQCESVWEVGEIPVLIDPKGECIKASSPMAVVDGILAKKNLGTSREMAPLTIALGPGFEAGTDVDYVIETMRGHDLGRIIAQGEAQKNTGIPGAIMGITSDRVIHAHKDGTAHLVHQIGDKVTQGEVIATLGQTPVLASISGILRGIIAEGYPVTMGLKIADIDPRIDEGKNCHTISDKARCIAGSVLELVCRQSLHH